MSHARSVKARDIGGLLAVALVRQLGHLSMPERIAIEDLAQRTVRAVCLRTAGQPLGARELAAALVAELVMDSRERVH